jgi:AbrB family looped-hinge helix DNA binding protein
MTIEMGADGRILIPAEVRRRVGLRPGTPLVVRVEDERLVLEPRDTALRRLQDRFTSILAEVSLVDELLADRRRA